jgi:hypothetical protein
MKEPWYIQLARGDRIKLGNFYYYLWLRVPWLSSHFLFNKPSEYSWFKKITFHKFNIMPFFEIGIAIDGQLRLHITWGLTPRKMKKYAK